MEASKSKFKSIINKVQSSTGELIANHTSFNKDKANSGNSHQTTNSSHLDLNSAIQYNHYLNNSYLQERDSRKLPLYEQIVSESDESEDKIIESIAKEFFLDTISIEQLKQNNVCDNQVHINDDIDSINVNIIDVQNSIDEQKCDTSDSKLKILELCVLTKLPQFSCEAPDLGDEFLHYIDLEKQRLTKQVTIVSKRLSDMILENDAQFKSELSRVNSIQTDLSDAIKICSNGRTSLSLTKLNFTSSGLSIVENYRRRETIINIIECLHNIKTIQNTMEHIENLLQYEKNFPTAIHLYHETFEILESMAGKYLCVKEMKLKMVDMLLLAEEQMDSVLARMANRFCNQTYYQLCKAYKLIGKNENAIHQLLMHFTNAIYDKAFSIVLGYVELFSFGSDLPCTASSTPIKSKKGSFDTVNSIPCNKPDLKRKQFGELCEYLKPESFLSCLIDLCRAMWDIMRNYFHILSFYECENIQDNIGLTDEEVKFAYSKIEDGILKIWSDIQQKIRTIVSSVKFVEKTCHLDDSGLSDTSVGADCCENSNVTGDELSNQDQLFFTFEEFIKILTVCEKMIELGEEFCLLYHSNSENEAKNLNNNATIELQNTLYKQTRAYFQSYHQVSMAELRIFLENETWTRCPIESQNEFHLIASLQEFSFMKSKLLKLKRNKCRANDLITKKSEKFGPSKESPKSPLSNSSSFILSPVAKPKHNFSTYFQRTSEDDSSQSSSTSPFDNIFSSIDSNNVTQMCFTDSDDDDPEEECTGTDKEIITTNTALNVLRLVGRYTHIMFLLQPISHDIIKALLELFDYYFFTVYRFFATDLLNTTWLNNSGSCSTNQVSSSNANQNQTSTNSHQLINQFSTELRSFIRRINDTLILNESSANNASMQHSINVNDHYSFDKSSIINQESGSDSPPKRIIKYPCPVLPHYVPINSSTNLFALCERILAIHSLIFISRQFYNLCPFLLDFLRSENENEKVVEQTVGKKAVDGFKLLQFYHNQMCSSVESLLYQCLFAVSSKILPYETIITGMGQVKWDLKEIPSIHSLYIDTFVKEIQSFNQNYLKLLETYELQLLIPEPEQVHTKSTPTKAITDEMDTPLVKLDFMSRRINILLWETIIRISNRSFVEGFSTAKKCTNEGRALMQLDYQQFLLHIEKIITSYFVHLEVTFGDGTNSSVRAAKSLLANEKDYVEEFVKAYYLTESIFIDWIRQRHEYTTKQIVSLINCIANDNRKLKSSLLAAIDTSILESVAN